MDGKDLDYELIRSRRRSVSILIKEEGVFVRAPLNTPQSRIDAFIEQKRRWIEEKLREIALKNEAFADAFAYDIFLFFGRRLTPVFTAAVKKPDAGEGLLRLPEKFHKLSREALLRKIAKWYKSEAELYLFRRLGELSADTGLPYEGFATSNAAGIWGSCDGENFIRLNWRLMLIEPELSDYVIIHELCHTAQHNHSAAFWNQVRAFSPEYAKLRRALKSRSVLMKLFRFSA